MWLGRDLVGSGSGLRTGAEHPNAAKLALPSGPPMEIRTSSSSCRILALPKLPIICPLCQWKRQKKRHGSQAGEAAKLLKTFEHWIILDPSRQRRQWQTLFATWRWSAQSKLESNRSNSKTGRVYHSKVISFDSPRGRKWKKRYETLASSVTDDPKLSANISEPHVIRNHCIVKWMIWRYLEILEAYAKKVYNNH